MKKLLKSKPALIIIVACVLLLGIGGTSGSDTQKLKDQIAQVTAELDTANSQMKLFLNKFKTYLLL